MIVLTSNSPNQVPTQHCYSLKFSYQTGPAIRSVYSGYWKYQKRGCFTYSSELSSYNRNNLGCDGSMNSNPHELRLTLLFSVWNSMDSSTFLHLTLSVVHGFKRVTIQIWKDSIGPILRVIQILHAN